MLYPEAPSFLHLLVNHLEHEAMKDLVGEQKAREVLESKNHYQWIYRTILKDEARIHEVATKYDLESFAVTSDVVVMESGN